MKLIVLFLSLLPGLRRRRGFCLLLRVAGGAGLGVERRRGRDRGLLAVKPKGLARGDCVVRGLMGFPLEATTRRTRGNSAVWARGGLMGPPTRPHGPE